jgi:hypothetical protein
MSFYNQNIPNSGDDPAVSQGQLLGNFGKINTDYSEDHVALTAAVNNGFHKKVTFQDVQVADPGLIGNLCSLFTKDVSGTPELFFENALDSLQLTNLVVGTTGTNYSIITPWNLKIQMGLSTGTSITFQDPFSSGPTIFFAGLSGVSAEDPKVTVITTTTLTYVTSSGTTAYYLVIGLP